MSITNLTPTQLRQAADLQETIAKLKNELAAILGERKSGQFVFTKLAGLARRGKLAESRGWRHLARAWAGDRPMR